jgi:hypothetical protein
MVSSREQRADFFVKHPKSREQVAESSQQGVKEQGAKSSCSLPNLLLALLPNLLLAPIPGLRGKEGIFIVCLSVCKFAYFFWMTKIKKTFCLRLFYRFFLLFF